MIGDVLYDPMAQSAPNRRPAPYQRRGVVVSIESRIIILRRHKVILDTALAELYSVSVKRLNEQVKRNRERFPADFMFQLTAHENDCLKSQIATSNLGSGGRRTLPYAFTEHGAIMASTVLNSKPAEEMAVFVVRAFVRLREMLSANRQIAARIEELEERLETHDSTIQDIIDAIRRLMMPPSKSRRRRIGFDLPPAKAGS
jgi:ORF6N domain